MVVLSKDAQSLASRLYVVHRMHVLARKITKPRGGIHLFFFFDEFKL